MAIYNYLVLFKEIRKQKENSLSKKTAEGQRVSKLN